MYTVTFCALIAILLYLKRQRFFYTAIPVIFSIPILDLSQNDLFTCKIRNFNFRVHHRRRNRYRKILNHEWLRGTDNETVDRYHRVSASEAICCHFLQAKSAQRKSGFGIIRNDCILEHGMTFFGRRNTLKTSMILSVNSFSSFFVGISISVI